MPVLHLKTAGERILSVDKVNASHQKNHHNWFLGSFFFTQNGTWNLLTSQTKTHTFYCCTYRNLLTSGGQHPGLGLPGSLQQLASTSTERRSSVTWTTRMNYQKVNFSSHLCSFKVGCPQVLVGSPLDANVSPVLGIDLDLRRVVFSKVGSRWCIVVAISNIGSFWCIVVTMSKVVRF